MTDHLTEAADLVHEFLKRGAPDTDMHEIREAFAYVRVEAELGARRRADYEEAKKIITKQHAILWHIGLETHEGEEQQKKSTSIENYRSHLRLRDEEKNDG